MPDADPRSSDHRGQSAHIHRTGTECTHDHGHLPDQEALACIPIAVWELSLGTYLTVKGFKPAAVAALMSNPTH
jgi:hypothetical protein